MADLNSGISSLTTDSCAGCHRTHTAQGPLLLNKASEEELCLQCHGATGTGATTDVETGIQYVPAANGTRPTAAVQLGALRSGGFEEARIGDPFMKTYAGSRGVSKASKVQVASAPAPVTSAHMPGLAGLAQPGRAWGNGANGSGPGPAVSISCGSCHNPHGNDQYRILNKLPGTTGINNAWVVNVVDYGVVAPGVYRSASSMGVLNGDLIRIQGNSLAGANISAAGAAITMVDAPTCPAPPIPPGTTCDDDTTPNDTLFTLSGVTAAGTGTGGTATRLGGTKVTDSAIDPDGDLTNGVQNPTKNYTVIQVKGTPGTPSTYWLYANQVTTGATTGDYFHYAVPWNGGLQTPAVTTALDAPNGIPGGSTASTIFTGGFNEQMTAWCASCHTRYWAWSEPTEEAGGTGPAYDTPRPGDDIFKYQHRTRGASGRACITCHVSHGSNAIMDGPNSSTYTYPNGTASASSRLLKVDNRGTCVLCHDPTATLVVGDQYPPGVTPPSAP